MTDQPIDDLDATVGEDEPTGGGAASAVDASAAPTSPESAATAGETGSESEYGNDTGYADDATVQVDAEPS